MGSGVVESTTPPPRGLGAPVTLELVTAALKVGRVRRSACSCVSVQRMVGVGEDRWGWVGRRRR